MAVILFFIFFFIATSYEQRNNKYKYTVLASACFILALIAGLREAWSWADAPVYMYSFLKSPDIFNFSFYSSLRNTRDFSRELRAQIDMNLTLW